MQKILRAGLSALIGITFTVSLLAQYSQPVRDVENPARTAYVQYASGSTPLGADALLLTPFTLATGKRLAIEFVAVDCLLDSDDTIPRVSIDVYQAIPGDIPELRAVPLIPQKMSPRADGKAYWFVSQTVRLYSEGSGFHTQVHIYHTKLTAQPYCSTVVSGHVITP